MTGNDTNDKMIFGYQGRYDEMRTKQNMVCGQMKSIFSYWHLGRIFSAQPALNSTFVKCVPRKDIFAAPTEPGLIVQFANLIKAWRLCRYSQILVLLIMRNGVKNEIKTT